MIPQFPKFKKLALSDKKQVEKFTDGFPPYSDFNFTSMWCWDTDGTIEISQLSDNLVVRFLDYITDDPFYSFIGLKETTMTARLLVQFSRDAGYGETLKLIPDVVAKTIDSNALKVQEDQDHFDYLYPIEKLCHYDGNKLRAKRNFSNRFKKKYTATVKIIDYRELNIRAEIMKLFHAWATNKKLHPREIKNEHEALLRFLSFENSGTMITTGIFIQDRLIAFSPNELLSGKYAVMHFEKADDTYVGIYAYLMEENAKILMRNGVKYLNFEQDLGLAGLRLSKKSFYPIGFLKKYRISPLSTG